MRFIWLAILSQAPAPTTNWEDEGYARPTTQPLEFNIRRRQLANGRFDERELKLEVEAEPGEVLN